MRVLGVAALWACFICLLLAATSVLIPVLWMLPRWIRRFLFRLEWRRLTPSRAYWRTHPSGPLAEWEKEVRHG